MKCSLRVKLLLPTLVVVAIGLISSSFLSYRSAESMVEEEVTREIDQLAQSVSSQYGAWVTDLDRDIRTLASLNEDLFLKVIEGDPVAISEANADLKEFAETYGVYLLTNVTNKNGLTVASSKAQLAGKQDLSTRGYFKKAIAGNKTISGVLKSKSTGKPIFVIAHPLRKSGTVSGVLLGAIDLTTFSQRSIDPIQVGSQGYAYMVAPSGKVAAHPDKSLINKVDLNNFDWGKRILSEKNGLDLYTYKGVEKVVSYHTDSFTGWTLCVVASTEDVYSMVNVFRNQSILSTVIILLTVALVVVFIVNPIVKALLNGVGFAKTISSGDLSQRLNLERTDELGELGSALDNMADDLEARVRVANTIAEGDLRQDVSLASDRDSLGKALQLMTDNLRSVIGQIQVAGGQINSGAVQVSETSQSLAQGATESAASLEEISSSMNEINSLTSQNTENVDRAHDLTGQVSAAAAQGNEQMKDMMTAMVEINDASGDISKIIKVIDEIAFQTNLLALNAAVEAARAGQHGKGFAVVAEEVRNLAARSAKAAKETADLIDSSVEKAQSGADIAEGTATALSEIVEGIHKVTNLVEDISISSKQQAGGINEINTGLGQVDQVTQQVTANSEESAATSEELASQARMLQEMLNRFKLPEGSVKPVISLGNSLPEPGGLSLEGGSQPPSIGF